MLSISVHPHHSIALLELMRHLIDVFVNGVQLELQLFFPLLQLNALLVDGDGHLLVFTLQLHIDEIDKKRE